MNFRLGKVTDCENRIQRDFIEFAKAWRETKEHWADTRRDQFERERLAELGPALTRFAAEVHNFSETITKANRDLRDEESEELA